MVAVPNNSVFWLYAPNVREGGGAILLAELIAKLPNCYIQMMLPSDFFIEPQTPFLKCQPGIWGRLLAEFKIFKLAKEGDTVLCFNGSAPLLPTKARIYIYLQNSILLEAGQAYEMSWLSALRISVERLALRLYWKNVKMFFVQTQSMKIRLEHFQKTCNLPVRRVKISPFFKKPNRTKANEIRLSTCMQREKQFFYPAYFQKHKNHQNLFLAWDKLVDKVPKVQLVITLNEAQFANICASGSFSPEFYRTVECVGEITFRQTQKVMAESSALIFPSKTESFGMPLLEAAHLGVPIIASERDFVRDVCDPDETFDPDSALSILRALTRFLNVGESRCKVGGAEGFWREIEVMWNDE